MPFCERLRRSPRCNLKRVSQQVVAPHAEPGSDQIMQSAPTEQLNPDRLMQFTGGYAPPLIIETALRLGVFDALDQGAKKIDQLLRTTGASARGMGMLLNALVGLDLLTKSGDDRFDLTE